MNRDEAKRLLLGEETLEDRLDMLASQPAEIENLARDVPEDEWINHVGRELAVPKIVRELLAEPLTRLSVALIEVHTEEAHGIKAPFAAMLEHSPISPTAVVLIHEKKGWFSL